MALINSHVDQYCDLGGIDVDRPDKPVTYSHSGGQMTMIKVYGLMTIMSEQSVEDRLTEFFGSELGSMFRQRGHSISVSFERHFNTHEKVEEITGRMRKHTDLKSLSFSAITDEYETLLLDSITNENVLIACWTHPYASFSDELKNELADKKKGEAALFMQAKNAMSPYLKLEAIQSQHDAFVASVLDMLAACRVKAKVLGPDEEGARPDLAEVKRAIFFHETPANWRPVGPGERQFPGKVREKDFSAAFAPPLSRQIMTYSAQSSKSFRDIAIGARTFSTMHFAMFPREVHAFNDLLRSLNSNDARNMPFRVTFHWEAIDFNVAMKRVFAGLFKWASRAVNGNFFENIRRMETMHKRDETIFVDARVAACTWIEPGEPYDLLNRRRSLLQRSLSRWGDPIIADHTDNPMRSLVETVSGMVGSARIKEGTKIPAPVYASMMPFHRSASAFERGETQFLTLDKGVAPHECFSSLQQYWLTLIFATPGSGKSVLMNRINMDMIAYTGGKKLPYLGIVDVGVSSSGLIRVIQAALPDDRKHEAAYTLLRNKPESAINPFDISLGCRKPLSREVTFISNFLAELLGVKADDPIISYMIHRLYTLSSDMTSSASPKLYQPGVEPVVDEALQALFDRGIAFKLSENSTWYSIVDLLAANGLFHIAVRAQRRASPVLSDVSRVLNEPTTKSDFTENYVRELNNKVMAASERYPIFSNVTTVDLDVARVIAIDLQEVIDRNTGSGNSENSTLARRQNTLMYMLARQLFVSKIAGRTDELPEIIDRLPRSMSVIYEKYWRDTFSDMQEVFKRFCMDEFHLTSGSPNIGTMVQADAREGRKWGLEILLASQLLRDFESLASLASTVFILNSETEEERLKMGQVFGFGDEVKEQMVTHLQGPRGAAGSNFLARYKLNDDEYWTILTNKLGPVQLWALTTKRQDRLVRDALYEVLPADEVLSFLAKAYPQATALSTWNNYEAMSSTDAGLVERITQFHLVQYHNYKAERERSAYQSSKERT